MTGVVSSSTGQSVSNVSFSAAQESMGDLDRHASRIVDHLIAFRDKANAAGHSAPKSLAAIDHVSGLHLACSRLDPAGCAEPVTSSWLQVSVERMLLGTSAKLATAQLRE